MPQPSVRRAGLLSMVGTLLSTSFMNGLPPHIAQIIAGHRDINVTLGYKAVYPHEAIQAHLAFLTRRRVPAAHRGIPHPHRCYPGFKNVGIGHSAGHARDGRVCDGAGRPWSGRFDVSGSLTSVHDPGSPTALLLAGMPRPQGARRCSEAEDRAGRRAAGAAVRERRGVRSPLAGRPDCTRPGCRILAADDQGGGAAASSPRARLQGRTAVRRPPHGGGA